MKRSREESGLEGLTAEEMEELDDEQIQALLEQADNEENLDSTEVKRMLVQFDKRIASPPRPVLVQYSTCYSH